MKGIIAQETASPGIAGKSYWKTADGRWAPETSLPYVTINTAVRSRFQFSDALHNCWQLTSRLTGWR